MPLPMGKQRGEGSAGGAAAEGDGQEINFMMARKCDDFQRACGLEMSAADVAVADAEGCAVRNSRSRRRRRAPMAGHHIQ